MLSSISYVNLSNFFVNTFSLTGVFLEDYYEALNDTYVNDLMGIFINLYSLNSILFLVVGFLLLVGSIICVVLVTYFLKFRNLNLNTFLKIYSILKNSYSLVFLRKQNLSKQGRSVASTRLFTKKTINNSSLNSYKTKEFNKN